MSAQEDFTIQQLERSLGLQEMYVRQLFEIIDDYRRYIDELKGENSKQLREIMRYKDEMTNLALGGNNE